MKRKQIQANLQRAIHQRTIDGDARGRRGINAVTDAAKRQWLNLQAIIKRKGSAAEINACLKKLAADVTASVEPVLMDTAEWGFDTAYQVWVDHLPAEWWKLALRDDPEAVLMEALQFNFPEPGGPGPTGKSKEGKRSATEKLFGRPKPKPSKPLPPAAKEVKAIPAGKPAALPKKKQVAPATAVRVKKYVRPDRSGMLKIVRSRGWKSRLDKWSSKITNKDKVAELIAQGFEKGYSAERIAKQVKPFVQGFTASARRIVRTEMARIENQMMEQTFKRFESIIEGYQVINPLDEVTRPTHAIRAGRIYWVDGRKKPSAADRPELPDEANCRCGYAPILTAPAPAELLNGPRVDTRTYADWFNRQPDEAKKKTVGAGVWKELKKRNKRPSFYDAVDPKTGQIINIDDLRNERPASTLSRRKKNKAAMAKNVAAAKKSLKYWPPES